MELARGGLAVLTPPPDTCQFTAMYFCRVCQYVPRIVPSVEA